MSKPAARKRAAVVKLPTRTPSPVTITGYKVGWLVEGAARGLFVDYPGNTGGPIAARSTQRFDAETVRRAIDERQEALLAFEDGRPIVLGLLADTVDLAVSKPDERKEAEKEALVDGKRVVLEGKDEIVLRCGEASITLRRNGRVVIRGAYVEARSKGVNRIRGGSVQIN